MDDTGLDAWLVANLPHIAPWIGLALFVVWAVVGIAYHSTRGRVEWERGYCDGQRWHAKQIGTDDVV